MGKDKIAIIGSGNWCVPVHNNIAGASDNPGDTSADHRGSAIAKIAGQNVKNHSDSFEERTPIWVFEEDVSGVGQLGVVPL